jgi:hypothetical protein
MRGRAIWAFGSVAALLLVQSAAHAQCTKDTDCKGDRVCEAGKCTAPAPAAPAPAAPSDVAPSADATASPAPPAEGASPEPAPPEPAPLAQPVSTSPAPAAFAAEPRSAPPAATAAVSDEPELQRRSRAALVSGIIMVSVGPLALLGALTANNAQQACDERLENDYPNRTLPSSERYRVETCDSYTTRLYVLGIGGAILTLGGVPLIIYGAKSVPKPPQSAQLHVVPWATQRSGGLKLRLDL